MLYAGGIPATNHSAGGKSLQPMAAPEDSAGDEEKSLQPMMMEEGFRRRNVSVMAGAKNAHRKVDGAFGARIPENFWAV